MATPIRDDGLPGPQKHLVIFVHGFSSSADCWRDLLKLLRSDPRFEAYEFRCYEYATSLIHIGLQRRLPSLKELSRGLGTFLNPFFGDAMGDAYIGITLVGHSMGGILIQTWLAHELQQGRGGEIKQIRQIILLGTPNLGSQIVSPMRKLLYSIVPNPQEKMLRILEPEISDASNFVYQKVVSSTQYKPDECPIPIHAFWGQKDRIVQEASARGSFPNSSPLPCDHFEMICPRSAESTAYIQLSDAILEPDGHQHVFEVEEFRFLVRVEPRPEDFEYIAEHGGKRRIVKTNNVAFIRREARFGRKNRCREIFTIKYKTRNEGFVKYDVSHPNVAPSDSTVNWDDHGTDALFQFHPEPRRTYSLNVEVFKGFDEGSCDVHHHLHQRCFFRKYVFQLDLSMYLEHGHRLSAAPNLCFLRNDPGHTALCSERNKCMPDPPLKSVDGVWRWELEHLREGIVDVRWHF
jgi:pimeloyl-ACP methyl ester carboxylesterase